MLAPMARREDDDEAAPSLLPTFVATRIDGTRTRLRAPDETAERDTHPDHRAVDEEVELEPTSLRVEPTALRMEPTALRPEPSGARRPAVAAGLTRSLMAADRVDAPSVVTGKIEGGIASTGTLSLGPSSTQDATPPTALPSAALQRARLTSAAPSTRARGRPVVIGLGLLAVIAGAAWVMLTPPPLPPLTPLTTDATALAGLPTSDFSVLARDLVFPGTEGLRDTRPRAPDTAERAREPAAIPSAERDTPASRTRARPAEASRDRAPPRADDGPRRGAEPAGATAVPPTPTTDPPRPLSAPELTTPVGADATLSITTRVGGSPVANVEILLDGRVVGRTPLRLPGVRPGRHDVEARGPHGSARKVVDIAPGSMEKLALELTTP